jgi:hypothetical protein
MPEHPTLRLLPWLAAACVWAGVLLSAAAPPPGHNLTVAVARIP